jgi:hypothetical protein
MMPAAINSEALKVAWFITWNTAATSASELHHRRRVQACGHGRRRRHRLRQPEVERELRALGKRAGSDQNERRNVEHAAAVALAGGEHAVQVIGARHAAEQQRTGEQTARRPR